jgi:hypothetical protein
VDDEPDEPPLWLSRWPFREPPMPPVDDED